WHHWVAQQHARAGELVHRAEIVSTRGGSKDLEDALRNLQRALELNPRDKEAVLMVLLVRLEQVLEEGAFDAGLLRSPIARAERAGVDQASVQPAMAVLLTSEGRTSQARKELAKALRRGAKKGRILYLAGRLEERSGEKTAALEHFLEATKRNPSHVASHIALAEMHVEMGETPKALDLLERVLN